jgi:hypothetical protein
VGLSCGYAFQHFYRKQAVARKGLELSLRAAVLVSAIAWEAVLYVVFTVETRGYRIVLPPNGPGAHFLLWWVPLSGFVTMPLVFLLARFVHLQSPTAASAHEASKTVSLPRPVPPWPQQQSEVPASAGQPQPKRASSASVGCIWLIYLCVSVRVRMVFVTKDWGRIPVKEIFG